MAIQMRYFAIQYDNYKSDLTRVSIYYCLTDAITSKKNSQQVTPIILKVSQTNSLLSNVSALLLIVMKWASKINVPLCFIFSIYFFFLYETVKRSFTNIIVEKGALNLCRQCNKLFCTLFYANFINKFNKRNKTSLLLIYHVYTKLCCYSCSPVHVHNY